MGTPNSEIVRVSAAPSRVAQCRSFLIIPGAVTLGLAAFEDVLEVRLLVKRCAIRHFIDELAGEVSVTFALRAVSEIVQLSLFFQLRHTHHRVRKALSRRYGAVAAQQHCLAFA